MNVVLGWLSQESLEAVRLTERWATAEDKRVAARRRPAAGRGASLLARAALRALLAEETGRTDWQILATAQGKPFVVDGAGRPGPSVSLSHGGGLVAVALTTTGLPLGLDIEPHRDRDILALAGYAFGPAERDWVAAGGPAAFYRIWSLREAMGKATGEGLSLAADRRDRIIAGPESGVWSCDPWWLAHCQPQHGYSLAVAVQGGGGFALQFVTWDDCPDPSAPGSVRG